MAVYWGHLQVLQKSCEWAKENLIIIIITEEIKIMCYQPQTGTEILLGIWH